MPCPFTFVLTEGKKKGRTNATIKNKKNKDKTNDETFGD